MTKAKKLWSKNHPSRPKISRADLATLNAKCGKELKMRYLLLLGIWLGCAGLMAQTPVPAPPAPETPSAEAAKPVNRTGDAFMGVYSTNLTDYQAQKLGLDFTDGVRITGVVSGSPAREYRLLTDDVIVSIGDFPTPNKRKFEAAVDSHYPGDKVNITLYRNGKRMEQEFVFGEKQGHSLQFSATFGGDDEEPEVKSKDSNSEHKIIIGSKDDDDDDNDDYYVDTDDDDEFDKALGIRTNTWGGIGWMPVWFVSPGKKDVNNENKALGFSEMREDGTLLNGIGGKFKIGNGLYLGGMFVWDRDYKKASMSIGDPANPVEVIRRGKVRVAYGGITLDKRYAITRSFLVGYGGMLGWGSWEIETAQRASSYDWENPDNSLSSSYNSYNLLRKSYILFQPEVEASYRLTSWLSMHAQVGYIMSYAWHDGWRDYDVDDEYETTNSPNTTFDGLTVSIGPWIGF